MSVLVGLVVALAACSNAKSTTGTGNTQAVKNASPIDVASIADITGFDSSDFRSISKGVIAYFDYVNAMGGVDGHHLYLPASDILDDQATNDAQVADEVVSKKIFAVVGVATPFFSGAKALAAAGIPTFGYVISSDWEDGPSMFGNGGSYLYFDAGAEEYAYVALQLHATNVGVVAYGVPQSYAACQAAENLFPKMGVHVAFSDLKFGYGGDPSSDVLQMKDAKVNLWLSCLDVTGNVAFVKSFSQNGVSPHEIWLNGYDQTTLAQYGQYMNGVVFPLPGVPFSANQYLPHPYAGLTTYLTEMGKYEPQYVDDNAAAQGWASATLFVQGLRDDLRDHGSISQAGLVDAINHDETRFNWGGLSAPTDWRTAHTQGIGPYCDTYVEVKPGTGGKPDFVPVFVQPGGQVFVCFKSTTDPNPVPPPPGTPTPQ